VASCAACGSTLLFIKKRAGGLQFCNDTCVARGQVAIRAQHIPESQALEHAIRLQHAPCPSCGGLGPVDVFTTHTVWSALIVTVWKSTPALSCKGCAVKSQVYATLAAALVGWWGFPWGLIVTPIQLIRNIVGMFQPAQSGSPSKHLKHIARMDLASRAVASHPQGTA
jgi:hypothetical protein